MSSDGLGGDCALLLRRARELGICCRSRLDEAISFEAQCLGFHICSFSCRPAAFAVIKSAFALATAARASIKVRLHPTARISAQKGAEREPILLMSGVL